jgi:uncharacterized protein (DUF362 family)
MSRGAEGITRREFIRGGAAALALPAVLGTVRPVSASGPVSALSVVNGPDPYAITVEAVRRLGGMEKFVSKGDVVVIKPNIGWDRRVEQAANTHPEVVHALAVMCLEASAKKVKIFDRTCNDARRCYRTSGMEDMVAGMRDGRVSLEFVKNNRFRKIDIPAGKSVKSWPIYQEVLDAQVLINVPVAKHHSISRLTLGIKNLMGVMGGNRGSFHSGLGQKLADLTSAVTPDLTVLDATRIMIRNGPSGGRMEDVKVLDRVAASSDPVALDAYGATLFNLAAADLSYVVAAHQMGLGEMDLARVRILER